MALQPCTTPLRRGESRRPLRPLRTPAPVAAPTSAPTPAPTPSPPPSLSPVASPGWTASVHPRTTTVFLLTSYHLPGIPLFLLSSLSLPPVFILSSNNRCEHADITQCTDFYEQRCIFATQPPCRSTTDVLRSTRDTCVWLIFLFQSPGNSCPRMGWGCRSSVSQSFFTRPSQSRL